MENSKGRLKLNVCKGYLLTLALEGTYIKLNSTKKIRNAH